MEVSEHQGIVSRPSAATNLMLEGTQGAVFFVGTMFCLLLQYQSLTNVPACGVRVLPAIALALAAEAVSVGVRV